MRSLVFEGNTWSVYEELRQKDKVLHKALCRVIKQMLRVIYKFDDKFVYIFAIGGHYDQF